MATDDDQTRQDGRQDHDIVYALHSIEDMTVGGNGEGTAVFTVLDVNGEQQTVVIEGLTPGRVLDAMLVSRA